MTTLNKLEAYTYNYNAEVGEYLFEWEQGEIIFEDDGFYLFNGYRLHESQNPIRLKYD